MKYFLVSDETRMVKQITLKKGKNGDKSFGKYLKEGRIYIEVIKINNKEIYLYIPYNNWMQLFIGNNRVFGFMGGVSSVLYKKEFILEVPDEFTTDFIESIMIWSDVLLSTKIGDLFNRTKRPLKWVDTLNQILEDNKSNPISLLEGIKDWDELHKRIFGRPLQSNLI